MNCKHCNAELEPGMTTCPGCGAEVENQSNKLPAGKIVLLGVMILAAVAVVLALVLGGNTAAEPTGGSEPGVDVTTQPVETTQPPVPTTLPDGNPEDVTCQGSYSVTEEEVLAQQDTVVATAGSASLTNGELQVYYWMQFYNFLDAYSDYIPYLGLNLEQGLDTQIGMDGTHTWQQMFLSNGLTVWHQYEALCQTAEANGVELGQDVLDYLQTTRTALEESAVSAGFASAEEMLKADMGPGVTMEAYMTFMERVNYAQKYYKDQVEGIQLTDEEVSAYFQEHEAEYAENGLTKETKFVDVRHILLTPQGGTTENGTTTYSEEEWAACRAEAQQMLDEFNKTTENREETFAALATEHTADPGSKSTGGLYTDVYEGQMVQEFNDWCFDPVRKYGDTEVVQTSYGCHIMFYVGDKEAWSITAKADLQTQRAEELVLKAMEEYPIKVDYNAIALGVVDFGN